MALPSKYEDGLSDLDYQAALTAQEAEQDFADLDEDEDEDETACEKDYADDEEEDPA